jgi:hypothetical protein
VAELADARDLKSRPLRRVRVRCPAPALRRINHLPRLAKRFTFPWADFCPCDCPCRGIQRGRGRLQVGRADDVVAIEHRPRLVAAHRHRHAFGDAGPDVIPDRGPPEIVQQFAGAAGRLARRPPALVEPCRYSVVKERRARSVVVAQVCPARTAVCVIDGCSHARLAVDLHRIRSRVGRPAVTDLASAPSQNVIAIA